MLELGENKPVQGGGEKQIEYNLSQSKRGRLWNEIKSSGLTVSEVQSRVISHFTNNNNNKGIVSKRQQTCHHVKHTKHSRVVSCNEVQQDNRNGSVISLLHIQIVVANQFLEVKPAPRVTDVNIAARRRDLSQDTKLTRYLVILEA